VRLDPSSSVQIHGSPLNSRQIAVTVYLLNYYTSSSSVSRSGSTDLRVSDPKSTSRYVTSGNPRPKTIAQKYSTSAEKKSFHPLSPSPAPACLPGSSLSTPPHPTPASRSPSLPPRAAQTPRLPPPPPRRSDPIPRGSIAALRELPAPRGRRRAITVRRTALRW
jgi:hypothetical protein